MATRTPVAAVGLVLYVGGVKVRTKSLKNTIKPIRVNAMGSGDLVAELPFEYGAGGNVTFRFIDKEGYATLDAARGSKVGPVSLSINDTSGNGLGLSSFSFFLEGPVGGEGGETGLAEADWTATPVEVITTLYSGSVYQSPGY